MTIDKEQLVSLLKEKSGLDRKKVEEQLSELITRIQKAAEEGKTFEVEGFGTFSMEEGRLQFEPVDTLETEINNKYAGMKPIELIGAFKEPERDEDIPEVDIAEADAADLDTEEKWAFDSEAIHEEQRPETEPTPHEKESSIEGADESDNVAEGASEPESSKTEEQEEADDVFDTVFGTADDETQDEVKQERPDYEKPAAEDSEEKPKDPIGTVVVAVVVVLVLGVGGWFIYDISNFGTSGSEVASSSPQTTATVPTSDNDNMQPGEQSGEGEEALEPEEPSAVSTEEEDTGMQPATQQQNRFGLMGEPNQAIANGYTIVVHSLRDRQQADQNRQQLQEAGFRAIISQAQIQGTTYYRVGIGQFETVSDAQQAISDIPERYQDNNFIKRIQ